MVILGVGPMEFELRSVPRLSGIGLVCEGGNGWKFVL